jgi:hypothetical protein
MFGALPVSHVKTAVLMLNIGRSIADEHLRKDEVGPWISFYTRCSFSVIYTYKKFVTQSPQIESLSAAAANFARAHTQKASSPQRRAREGAEKVLSSCSVNLSRLP